MMQTTATTQTQTQTQTQTPTPTHTNATKMEAQKQSPNRANLKLGKITLENAPAELVKRAQEQFAIADNLLAVHRVAFSNAQDQSARKSARNAFKTERTTQQNRMDVERRLCRQTLDVTNAGGEERMAAKNNLIVARLALQVLKQGKRVTDENTDKHKPVKKNRKKIVKKSAKKNAYSRDETTNTIKEVSVDAAVMSPVSHRVTVATSPDCLNEEALKQVEVLMANDDAEVVAIGEAVDVRQQLQQYRKSCKKELNAAKKRDDELGIEQLTHKLAVATLAMQIFNRKSKQTINESIQAITVGNAPPSLLDPATIKYNQMEDTLKPLRETIHAANKADKETARKACMQLRKQSMVTLNQERKSARKAFDAAKDPAAKTTAHDQLVVIRLVIEMVRRPMQVAKENAIQHRMHLKQVQDITLTNATPVVLDPATEKFSHIQKALDTSREAIESATDKSGKQTARKAFVQQRKQSMAALNQERKVSRAVFDATTDDEAMAACKEQLIVARLAIELFKRSFQHAPNQQEEEVSHYQKREEKLAKLSRKNTLQQVQTTTVENAPLGLLAAATENFSHLQKMLTSLCDAVKTTEAKHNTLAARKTFMQQRKQVMTTLRQARKAARAAFDATTDEEEMAAARDGLIVARLSIELMKNENSGEKNNNEQAHGNININSDDKQETQQEEEPPKKGETIDKETCVAQTTDVLQVSQVCEPPMSPSVLDSKTDTIASRPFDEELQTLAGMGFCDEDILIPMLVQNKGSVHATICMLISDQ